MLFWTEFQSFVANSLEEIKQQQEDLKKEFLPLKTNTQAFIRSLEVNQQKLTESQKFISEDFKDCKSNPKNNKNCELKYSIAVSSGDIKRRTNKINDLEQYSRCSMVEISKQCPS